MVHDYNSSRYVLGQLDWFCSVENWNPQFFRICCTTNGSNGVWAISRYHKKTLQFSFNTRLHQQTHRSTFCLLIFATT